LHENSSFKLKDSPNSIIFNPMISKNLFVCWLFFWVSIPAIWAQQNEIRQIRNLYYEELPFDTITVLSDKVIPGLGSQTLSMKYIYLDCQNNDCSEIIGSDVSGVMLRKVMINKGVNTSSLASEYLFNNDGQIAFYYRKIGSEDYFYDTGRECAEERYYLSKEKPVQIKISPCKEYEPFEEELLIAGFPKSHLDYLKTVIKNASLHLKSFASMKEAEQLDN